jgi:hypothetical protein
VSILVLSALRMIGSCNYHLSNISGVLVEIKSGLELDSITII